jgi:hypothetical protein
MRVLTSVASVVGASQLAAAQTTVADIDAQRKSDLVTAYRILVNEGILDSSVTCRFGQKARMQMQALLISPEIVSLDEAELFTPAEFDINRPWEHLKEKTLDDAARAKVDRSQFGLDQTQTKQ